MKFSVYFLTFHLMAAFMGTRKLFVARAFFFSHSFSWCVFIYCRLVSNFMTKFENKAPCKNLANSFILSPKRIFIILFYSITTHTLSFLSLSISHTHSVSISLLKHSYRFSNVPIRCIYLFCLSICFIFRECFLWIRRIFIHQQNVLFFKWQNINAILLKYMFVIFSIRPSHNDWIYRWKKTVSSTNWVHMD